jgi:hypothetical protein
VSLTAELTIESKQCVIDATATGIQSFFSISPNDCSSQIAEIPSFQKQSLQLPTTVFTSRQLEKDDSSTTPKKDGAPSPVVPNSSDTHPPYILQADGQIMVPTVLGAVTFISADIIVFNTRITRLLWRQLTRAARATSSISD